MAIPDYQSLMRPVLEVLADGEHPARSVIARISDDLNLSAAEREEMLPSGRITHDGKPFTYGFELEGRGSGLVNIATPTDAATARYWATLGPDRIEERMGVAAESHALAARLGVATGAGVGVLEEGANAAGAWLAGAVRRAASG